MKKYELGSCASLRYHEAAFASAWSALDFWEIEAFHKNALHTELSDVANFLQTLKSNRSRPGILELRERLRKISGQGESRTEVWRGG